MLVWHLVVIIHWLYVVSLFLLQGEYDSPGDDMNDRKVGLACAASSALSPWDHSWL